ncbi:MAG: amino acid racemase [Candidatus Lokiarchaeota archaeon]|jgi:aspartate racemase|nr:amino acid racemase [Candidatus Lokiarchaeota archaeon]
MKKIGILGGMSYESTIKYYDLILQKYYDRYQDYNYPEILIYSLNFQKVIDYELGVEEGIYVEYLMTGINSLQKGGVDFIVMAANSPHAVYDELIQKSKVPILSIVEVTAEKAQQENLREVLLLGIKYTMQAPFYKDYFAKLGMEVITPSDSEQDLVNRIIFDELVIGEFTKKSKQMLLQIINNYNVDGVILGCTELPLILQQNDSDLTLLDTVEIHVEAALEYCLDQS